MTLKLLTENSLEEKLTLSMEDSPAKMSVLQELKRAWRVSEAVYFSRLCGWPKKSDRSSFSLKTSEEFARTCNILQKKWPPYAMIVGGVFYPLMTWEHCTKEKDGSCWLTPKAMMVEESYETYLKRMQRSKDPKTNSKTRPSSLCVQVATPMFWPTPTAQDFKRRGPNSKQQGLSNACQLWPTPAAGDYRDNGSPSEYKRHSPSMASLIGGQLNPTWVEWLMGVPLGWTELNALGTEWFRSKSKKRLKDLCTWHNSVPVIFKENIMKEACQEFAVALERFFSAIVTQNKSVANVTAPVEKKAKAEKVEKPAAAKTADLFEPKHTVEETQKLCVKVATVLGDKNKVREILKKFGAEKVGELLKEKLDLAYAALEAVLETKPATGAEDDGF
jgi:hypothetical protein